MVTCSAPPSYQTRVQALVAQCTPKMTEAPAAAATAAAGGKAGCV